MDLPWHSANHFLLVLSRFNLVLSLGAFWYCLLLFLVVFTCFLVLSSTSFGSLLCFGSALDLLVVG